MSYSKRSWRRSHSWVLVLERVFSIKANLILKFLVYLEKHDKEEHISWSTLRLHLHSVLVLPDPDKWRRLEATFCSLLALECFVWFVFLHNCKFYFSFWIILMIGKVLGLLYWSKLQENWRGKGIGGVTVWATGEHSDVSGLILPVLYFAGLQDWPGAYFRVVPERQEVGVREARLWPPWWLLG